jgi:hypothetical protein
MSYTRAELYEAIWSDTLTKTAASLNVRVAELSRACVVHQIPVPSSGYWTRKQMGLPVSRPPLPPAGENDVRFIKRDSAGAVRKRPKRQTSDGRGKKTDYDQMHLAIINLMSSGAEPLDVMHSLGLTEHAFARSLKIAAKRLEQSTGLSGEALNSIFFPRPHGTPPHPDHLPRYSGPAITLKRAEELVLFHGAAENVFAVGRDEDAANLSGVARWLSGWRPADHWTPEEVRSVLRAMDVDHVFYSCPDGLRSDGNWHEDRIPQPIELDIDMDESQPEALYGMLHSDIYGPGDNWVIRSGALVAVPLTEADRSRWQNFLNNLGTRFASRLTVKLVHAPGDPPSLKFERL